MSDSLAPAEPPDESGAETFRRYLYQAHVAVPFCLDCLLGKQVVAVVPEYFEDLALQIDGGWRLLQIKTRDERRGPWRLAHILAASGGVPALYRSYRALNEAGQVQGCTFELLLEGSLEPGDGIEKLRAAGGVQDSEIVERFMDRLDIDEQECRAFLPGFRLHPDQPSRVWIEDRNFRVFSDQAAHLAGGTVKDIYDRLIARIVDRMGDAPLPGDDWPTVLLDPAEDPVNGKRLSRQDLMEIIGELVTEERPRLKRVLEAHAGRPSAMEEKMLAAEASAELIDQARQLRANAQSAVAETLAAGSDRRSEELEDLHARLRTRFVPLPELHADRASPAAAIWDDLINRLGMQAAQIDSRGLLRADPDLLLGEVCEMTDQCNLRWAVDP